MVNSGPPRFRRRPKVGGDTDPEVFCANEQSAVDVDIAKWQSLAAAVLKAEGVRGGTELSIFFVDEANMSELNAEHMGEQGPTDVLSFPIDGGEVVEVLAGPSGGTKGPDRSPVDRGDLPLLLGDIVICPEVAVRQAPDHAGTVDDEFALLVTHGLLHILGWDHATSDERDRMWARERELLSAHHWHGPVPTAFRQDSPEESR
jgi:probable rRNA maturation factor